MIKYLRCISFSLIFLTQPLYAQLDQSERLFQSEIFKAYQEQYKIYTKSFTNEFQIEETNPRAFYQTLVDSLRRSEKMRTKISQWLFLNVDLSNEIIQAAQKRLNISLDITGFTQPGDLATIMEKVYQASLAPEYDGYIKSQEAHLDPFMMGNFPYVLHTHHFAGQEVKFIRMPAPARTLIERKKIKSQLDIKINEDFETFLGLQSKENKKHLYVSFLNDWKGAENQFFHEKLAKLEQHPDFGENFFYVAFDKDTDFYFQRGEFDTMSDPNIFLNTFLSRLDKNQNYLWPSRINKESWQGKYNEIIKNLYKKLFKGKVSLTVEERQNFIEISYSRMIRALLEEIKPQTCNLTCHYTIDRGPSTIAIFLLDLLYQPGKGIDNREALKMIALLFDQPLLLQNRPAHEYRVNRVINILEILEQVN